MKNNKDKLTVNFQLTTDQYKLLKKKSHLNEQSISAYIRTKTLEL